MLKYRTFSRLNIAALFGLVAFTFSYSEDSMACPDILNHKMHDLAGNEVNLCDYAGKVVLAVNTASYCGNTPQYKGLEALYKKYKAAGLVVVGFPANDFGSQEPGTSKEIKDFCERTYGVEFPMMEKTSVVPGQANPLFERLTKVTGDAPEWNFHKYLLARDGKRAYSFAARTKPESAEVVQRIEALLAEKP
ncbi:MAG: glutathione peroxidase [Burkholderiales bacterium]